MLGRAQQILRALELLAIVIGRADGALRPLQLLADWCEESERQKEEEDESKKEHVEQGEKNLEDSVPRKPSHLRKE